MRKLAERSQESAGQIQAIVTQIQAETSATILASEEGAKEVRSGAALAREVVDALERISGMVDETTTAAKEISIATQQQRSASDQVVSAMTQVSDVSRQYAVGSKQAAAAAAQLNVLAAELRVVDRAVPGQLSRWRELGRRPGAGRDLPRRGRGTARLAVRGPAARSRRTRRPRQLVAGLFRDAHTVKGSARMLGLDGVVDVAHRAEDLLGALRDGRLAVRNDLVDVLLVAAESISRSMPGAARPVGDEELAAVVAALDSAVAGDDPVAVPRLRRGGGWPSRDDLRGRGGDSIRVPTRRVHDLVDVVGEAELDVRRITRHGRELAALAAEHQRAGRARPRGARRCDRRARAVLDALHALVAARRPARRRHPRAARPGPRTRRAGWPTSATARWAWRWCRCAGWSPASRSWSASSPRRARRRRRKDVALVLDGPGRRARHPGAGRASPTRCGTWSPTPSTTAARRPPQRVAAGKPTAARR